MTVLVTGATGNVGRGVVRRLLEAGRDVRALSRRPAPGLPAGVAVYEGDLGSPETLRPALAGVSEVFLFPVPHTAGAVAELARRAGVRRVVVLSSGAVTDGYDTDYHLPVERAVEAAGLAWTHVRPGEFAMNKLALWGPPIRAERVVREPLPDAAWYPVHEEDIAEVAALALTEPGHEGRAYTLNGPELLTHRRQVELIAEAMGEEIRLETVTLEEAREIYRAQGGFAAENADFLLGFEDYGGAEADPAEAADFAPAPGAVPPPTASDVTGRPARTFRRWARDHAEAFRA
ncbi:SDR family oxidoreductase [Streptomyces profundus]|uniref:SDR family oxidoreductase n=1 Tax=Streptomyces profundus TaxID=2867410 RepID=UPI001D1649FE|nr:NAD(P)H-binding protein [Streptomyces sp. MA3_2.13]UED83511.1 NAD(P)H-binding protein [Streptomyces sp. MA3_2.13]